MSKIIITLKLNWEYEFFTCMIIIVLISSTMLNSLYSSKIMWNSRSAQTTFVPHAYNHPVPVIQQKHNYNNFVWIPIFYILNNRLDLKDSESKDRLDFSVGYAKMRRWMDIFMSSIQTWWVIFEGGAKFCVHPHAFRPVKGSCPLCPSPGFDAAGYVFVCSKILDPHR